LFEQWSDVMANKVLTETTQNQLFLVFK